MMWRKWNDNPCGKSVGDCAVRAIGAALDISWDEAYDMLCDEGRRRCDMPDADAVWGAVLRQHGFTRHAIPGYLPEDYTAWEFALDHPRGVYVLAFGGHVVTIINGTIMDSWDSENEVPMYYYKRGNRSW